MPKARKSVAEEIAESLARQDEDEKAYAFQMYLARKKELRHQGRLLDGLDIVAEVRAEEVSL